MRSNSLKESLSQILEPQHILSCHEDLDRYSCDALTPSRAFYAEEAFNKLADLIVRPGSTSEIREILRWAQESKVSVIPYGGGTGVMGGQIAAHISNVHRPVGDFR